MTTRHAGAEGPEERPPPLSKYPNRCPVIPEADDIGVEYRHLIWGHYRTVLRIEGSTVSVVRVVHGAQLLETGTLETTELPDSDG